MNKRIVSLFLCIALTIIPVVSLSATETEEDSDRKSTVTVTPETEPTETPTSTPTTEPSDTSKSSRSRSDEKETPSPKEEVEDDTSLPSSKKESTTTPTPTITPSPTPAAEPTETPAPTPDETGTSKTSPVEDLEDDENDENIPSAKSKLREPVRAPGDTTWQNDWTYTLSDDSIILKRYIGTSITNLVVPSYAIEDGVTYNNVKFASDARFMFSSHKELETIDLHNVDTSNVTNMGAMFTECDSLTGLNLTGFDTSSVTSMNGMFYGCDSLTELNLTDLDTSSVITMSAMFRNCKKLTNIDFTGFDTSSVTDMSEMFCSSGISNIDVTGFDTSSVTNMNSMFNDCRNLKSIDVTHFDTSSVTDMGAMFYDCSGLTSLDVTHFDTSNVHNMSGMFGKCSSLESLDVTHFNTSNTRGMSNMFESCKNLANIDVSHFDTSNVYNMSQMFNYCDKLENLDLSNFDTSSLLYMDGMFFYCKKLKSLDLSSFDLSKLSTWDHILSGCSDLELIKTPKNLANLVDLPGIFVEKDAVPVVQYTTLPQNSAVSKIYVRYGTPTSITVDPREKTILTDEEFTITATVLPTETSTKKVTWSSDKPSIATVDSDGKVKGISEGTATITARTVNGLEATCVVTVISTVKPVTSIVVNPTERTIAVNDEFTIVATVLPEDATDKSVTWSSDKPEIATVDTNGKVKGIAIGTATITAKTVNDLEATCVVKVIEGDIPVESISVNPTTKTILIDDEFIITATVLPIDATDRSVTWSSDKPAIATVDNTGRVKGIAEGIAVITATTSNNLSATCEVTVKKAPAPTYRLIVVDNRTSPPHPELVTASVTRLEGDRYLLINDSDGKTIRPWIKTDSSLKYDSMVVYDMRLTDSRNGGNDMNDFGECTIRLALPSDMSNTTGTISLVTIKDGTIDKSLAYSVKEVDGVLCIIFTTPHFTDFAILYKKPAKKIIPPPKPEHHDTESTTTVTTVQQYYEWPVANPNVNRVLDSIPKTGDISQ